MSKPSPNPRVRRAERNGHAVRSIDTTSPRLNPEIKVYFKRPMPCVVILVHGVNDIGEAYATQASGICAGLNLRLGRQDLTPGEWDTPKACLAQGNYNYARVASKMGRSPIIPFYWGYRPVDRATYEADVQRYREELRRRGPAGAQAPYDAYYLDRRQDPKSGFENTDCFNNALDKDFAKGGGVFANATTNLVDMWGPGGDILGIVKWFSGSESVNDGDLSHAIYRNPHRIYMVHAAHRLANLIKEIRDDPTAKNDSINIVAHSQGTLITLLANFLVTQAGKRPADCVVLNHSPYSLEVPFLERRQSLGPQQTTDARVRTFANFCQLMDKHRQTGPSLQQIAERGIGSLSALQEDGRGRDNHGRVYNYFCPHDMTVSLHSVRGIGWQGVPPEVSSQCGPALRQRMFAEDEPVYLGPRQVALHRTPLPIMKRASNTPLPDQALRDLNGERLPPEFRYTFRLPAGCRTLGPADHPVNVAARGAKIVSEVVADPRPPKVKRTNSATLSKPSDSQTDLKEVEALLRAQGKPWTLTMMRPAISGLRVWRYETTEEMRADSAATPTEISNHSAIVLSEEAAKHVTAFDLAIGRCQSFDDTKEDGGAFWQKLVRMADWRWSDQDDDRNYYTSGILPKNIKETMNHPPSIAGVVNQTTIGVVTDAQLRDVDNKIARLEREKGHWQEREWHERRRSLQRERDEMVRVAESLERFPVAPLP